ncbi:MAG: carbohydrate ABC transporter permease [Paenibacillaceae bacterium]
MHNAAKLPKITLLCLLFFVLVLMIFPFLVMLSTALRPLPELFKYPPTWLPQTWSWRNFVDIWSHVPMAHFMLNSLIVSGGATALNLIVSIPAAYAIARLNFPGKTFFKNIVLYTQMFSPIILILGLFKTMAKLDLLNSHISLIVTYGALSLAFSIWFLTSFFRSIPEEIEEAAKIDGCSNLGILYHVVIPLSLPGLVATTLFAFIWSWNDFLIALTFLSTPLMQTLPLGIYAFVGQFIVQWNYLMAGAIITTIPVLLMFLYIEKFLIRGLTSGAVK